MFRRPADNQNQEARALRGTILWLMNMAVAQEINPEDPHKLLGATLVNVLREHSTFGTTNAATIRNAVRWLSERGYVETEWFPTGDFKSVRLCAKGQDLVEADTNPDAGVRLPGQR